MTLRFVDGFDHYTITQVTRKWSGINTIYGTPSIQSATTRFGTGQALSIPAVNGTGIDKTLPGSYATLVVGFAFRPVFISTTTKYICMLNDAGNTQAGLAMIPGGQLAIWRGVMAAQVGVNSTNALSMNTWYYIELKMTIHNTTGSFEVRVNGVNWLSATNQNTRSTANNSANSIGIGSMAGFGAPGISQGITCFFDDLYVLDTGGTVNNDFLGDMRVETLYPDGNGTTTQLTPSSGNNYTCVDEPQATDDTDYVSSATPGQKDTYAMSSLAGNPASIAGVQTVLMARKDSPGSRNAAAVIRSGGADYDGATVPILDSYSCLTEVRETDPATSAAWTVSGVNAVEAGIKVIS